MAQIETTDLDRIEKEARLILINLDKGYRGCVREGVADILEIVHKVRNKASAEDESKCQKCGVEISSHDFGMSFCDECEVLEEELSAHELVVGDVVVEVNRRRLSWPEVVSENIECLAFKSGFKDFGISDHFIASRGSFHKVHIQSDALLSWRSSEPASVENILKLVCLHTGQRVSLSEAQLDEYIAFARGLESRIDPDLLKLAATARSMTDALATDPTAALKAAQAFFPCETCAGKGRTSVSGTSGWRQCLDCTGS